MDQIRKPYQGIINIIRFNWHLYAISIGFVGVVYGFNLIYLFSNRIIVNGILISLSGMIIISLLVSFYVYDLSSLYTFKWLDKVSFNTKGTVLNIHAGFDETSSLLQAKYSLTNLIVYDFYDPLKHTEISIKRARKLYQSFPNTQRVNCIHLPLKPSTVDTVFVIFSAHEIRNKGERILFFNGLNEVLKDDGQIIVTEHIRDVVNFMAYNIGFFHFYSQSNWMKTFCKSGFKIVNTVKITPFVTTFILRKDGTTA